MTKLRLSIAIGDYDRSRGLLGGSVQIVLGVRNELAAAQPWLPGALRQAFTQAKAAALARLAGTSATKVTLPFVEEQLKAARAVLGDDHWPYGVASSRRTLDAFVHHHHAQGLSARRGGRRAVPPGDLRDVQHLMAAGLREAPLPAVCSAACRALFTGAFMCAALAGAPSHAAEPPAGSLAATYQSRADQLIGAALVDDEGYANLVDLCDRIGHRLSGSESLARAVDWAAALMRRQGLANVALQPVRVPKWVRGQESAAIVSPVARPLRMLGLGMSVGTPAGGIAAEVVVVSSLEQLERMDRAQVEGRIVVFDVPYESYGRSVRARYAGPTQAAAKGAVAALVRSITPLAVQLPHTGATGVNAGGPNIPAAAITPEDAALLSRLAVAGGPPVRVQLAMQAHREPDDAPSANVIGEIVGREKPEEVVVLGGHLDSWDVGQGAQDDGSGIMATLSAVRLIDKLGLKPRRTIRVVFWTNEENGGAGGKAYRAALTDAALANHVAAIEMDGGAEAPVGYGYGFSKPGQPALRGEQRSFELLRDIASLLKPVGASTILPGGHGADIEPLMNDGVPGLGETTTMAHYFDWHHTEADTLDKVDPVEFRKNVASLAVMAFVLADMPERLAGRRGD